MDGASNGNSDNNVIGKDAMRIANGALRNVAVGNGTGGRLTSGNRNVIIGYRAGFNLVTEAHNTLVGHDANLTLSAGITNSTALGSNAVVTTSNTIQLGNASVSSVNTSGTLTAGTVTYPNTHGTAGQVLTTAGSGNLSWGWAAIREVADQFSPNTGQTSFTLTQTPATNSKVKMYINGLRISNTAYSISGTTLTYIASNNGGNVLMANDRVQFDYYY
jgi:hypothetical protein